jgi:hypothetical protein
MIEDVFNFFLRVLKIVAFQINSSTFRDTGIFNSTTPIRIYQNPS